MVTWRWAVVVAWLGILAVTSHARLPVWQSDYTLWRDGAEKAPIKPRPILNFGRTQELSGDLFSAKLAYVKAISLAHDIRRGDRKFAKAAAQSNLAHVYIKEGHFASAWLVLQRVLLEYPDFPYAHYNRGAILWLHGSCTEATIELRVAQAIEPSLSEYPGSCVISR